MKSRCSSHPNSVLWQIGSQFQLSYNEIQVWMFVIEHKHVPTQCLEYNRTSSDYFLDKLFIDWCLYTNKLQGSRPLQNLQCIKLLIYKIIFYMICQKPFCMLILIFFTTIIPIYFCNLNNHCLSLLDWCLLYLYFIC